MNKEEEMNLRKHARRTAVVTKQAVRIPTENSCEHLLHSVYVIRNGMRMVAEIPYLAY